jgi:hypothetical protein
MWRLERVAQATSEGLNEPKEELRCVHRIASFFCRPEFREERVTGYWYYRNQRRVYTLSFRLTSNQ